MDFKVGVIGNGFVGEAQAFSFSPISNVKIYDIDTTKSNSTLDETLKSDYIFVCVPTPMKKNGTQDISYIDSVFKKSIPGPIYIIKSTVLPGTTEKISDMYPELDIVFSPEFLTERSAKLDIITQTRIIVGGKQSLIKRVRKLFEARFKNKTIIETDSKTAEFIKYMNNTFFASKVSLMNEFYRLSVKCGVDWDKAVYGFVTDQRIGDSHLDVPGHDGKFGFGGTCFPKDINAFISYSKSLKINMNILEAAWKTNLEVRPEEDWKDLKGRAVSDEE